MVDDVTTALSELYRVFARYPLSKIAGCPCCVTNGDRDALDVVALRELSGKQLGTFAWKAMTTFGDVDDYRHFLPRICELAVQPQSELGFDVELIGRKLSYGGWREWPEEESAAILRWAAAIGRDDDLRTSAEEEETSRAPVPPLSVAASPPAPEVRVHAPAMGAAFVLQVELVGVDAPPWEIELRPDQRIEIGRHPNCHVMVPTLLAGTVNSVVLTDSNGKSTLRSTGHPFPIRVNGERLASERALESGDVTEHDANDGKTKLRLTYRAR
ncbi:hypothetical protein BH09MYX1_BH09MYX1_02400 [soil metagenome]